MVEIINNNGGDYTKGVRLTDEQVQVILDALLHEIERHNEAESLVNAETIREAIKAEKKEILAVYNDFCDLLDDK